MSTQWIKCSDRLPDYYKICEVIFEPTIDGIYTTKPRGFAWLAWSENVGDVWTLWGTNLIINVNEWSYRDDINSTPKELDYETEI